MVTRKDITQLEDVLWEIPSTFRDDMRVPARLYADEDLLTAALKDRSLEQLVNTACLPGVVKYALAMPDIHQGYGPPIGGVIAMDMKEGVVSPGAVGYDINCGVRLMGSHLMADEVRPVLDQVVDALHARVPSGVGRGGDVRLSERDMDAILEKGAAWAVKKGYGRQEDLDRTEEHGTLAGASAAAVSSRAKQRGKDQLGTLGAGNHFVEVGEVAEVFDERTAQVFGVFPGQFVAWVHSGSRGLGHQVATDYIRALQRAVVKYGIKLPDRELVCAPISSPEGQEYMSAMAAAANFAWANRQLLMHRVRETLDDVLAPHVKNRDFYLIYDVAHNIAKVEEFSLNGRKQQLIVHRKGATRAFGPGRSDLPQEYQATGQPVLVPGDMGTASYLLVGTAAAENKSFASSCHGAGRVWSRTAAKRQVRGEQLRDRLAGEGILVRGPAAGLAEEAPEAYKDIDRVVDVVDRAGIACRVARIVPLGVVKG